MALIKEFYINLDRCKDKRREMELKFPNATRISAVDGKLETPESILPYKASKRWRDPYYNRRMTKGEVGCTLSHIKAWEICVELNEPIIVFEDDIEIVADNYQEVLANYSEDYDFLYLSKKYIEGEIKDINFDLETGAFYYWTSGYFIKPNVAKALLDVSKEHELIPADEVLPSVLDAHRWPQLNLNHGFKWAAFTENLVTPKPDAFENSDTESLTDIWEDFKFHIITVGTDLSKTTKLSRDPRFNIVNLGEGVEWKGGDMALGPGGGQKINLVKDFLNTVESQDIVMFLDGHDTFIVMDEKEILKRYFEFAKEIVFSAEKLCWPDESLANSFEVPETGYRYLNSGTYIGTAKALKMMFYPTIQDHEDDQLYVQKQYLTGKHSVCLDHESYIFFCLSAVEDSAVYSGDYLINTETNCTTCVVHGNGGEYTKVKFESLYRPPAKQQAKLKHYHETNYIKTELDTDLCVLSNLIPKEWCEQLIKACELDGKWKSLPNDKFPGQEIRLNTLDDQSWIEEFREFFKNTLEPLAEQHWPCLKMYGMRDVFVIKYSGESQTSLPLHHDMSLVTFACKLNNDYEGGELNFPRQGISNKNIGVGQLLMWPGQVTHPHESLTMKSGTKYGLVVWSSRDANDGEYYEN